MLPGQQHPVRAISLWIGFACALFALSSFAHGAFDAAEVAFGGALLLFAWAAWLAHGEH